MNPARPGICRLNSKWIGVLSSLVIVFAFLRGSELHGGLGGGLIYVLIAFASIWLVIRSVATPYRFALVVLLVFVLLMWSILFWPFVLFPDPHSHFGMFAFKNRIKEEFNAVIMTDPAFSKLSIAFHEYKNTDISIEGRLPDEPSYIRFRSRILSECPSLSKSLREDSTFLLKWDILIEKNGHRITGYDEDLSGSP